MLNATFVVWRESFEALLIVVVVLGYLKKQPGGEFGKRYVWIGVWLGIIVSALLGLAIQYTQTQLQGTLLEIFQVSLLYVSALLMLHMCIWMKSHATTMKRELEGKVNSAIATSSRIALITIPLAAVSREGIETALYLIGMSYEAQTVSNGYLVLLLYSLAGLLLTFVTGYFFVKGIHLLSLPTVFKITGIFLLVTGGNFIVVATSRLLQADLISPLKDNVWDTSWLISDGSMAGNVVRAITGYHSSPALITVFLYAAYWVLYFVFTKFFITAANRTQFSSTNS